MNTLDYDYKVYYQGQYWNGYPYVQQAINRRLSGDPAVGWLQQFQKISGGRRFRKALMLNCGNGWVERDLLAAGVIDEAVGVDYALPLLDQARQAAGNLPLRYYQIDTNTAAFPEGGFDLVVNYAAAHHITAINRVFCALATLLPADGYFVHFDYVGPHRNQYAPREWRAVQQLNRQLPPALRQRLRYPHLITPHLLDPSEAVHSELILPLLRRYFTILDLKWLGGALAYPVLTHNRQFAAAPAAVQAEWLRFVMEVDEGHLALYPDASLFAFVVAQPNKQVLHDTQQLACWQGEENRRERRAAHRLGFYYRPHLRLSLLGFLVSVGDVTRRCLHNTTRKGEA